MRILKEDRVNLLTLVNFLQEAGCEVSFTEPFNKELAVRTSARIKNPAISKR